jgi:hypothetical protein
MLIAIVILLALAIGAVGGYLYGAKALRAPELAAELENKFGEMKIENGKSKIDETDRSSLFAFRLSEGAARDKLEGK